MGFGGHKLRIRYFKQNFYRQLVSYLAFLCLGLLLFDSFHNDKPLLQKIIFGVLTISYGLLIAYQYFLIITIDENGIKHSSLLRSFGFSWDSIGQLKVIPSRDGKTVRIIVLKSTDPKELYKRKNIFNRYMKCITFPITADAVALIVKYRSREGLFDDRLFYRPMKL